MALAQDTFHAFFDRWIAEQNQHLQELLAASHRRDDDAHLPPLLRRVLHHYDHYYHYKSQWAATHILSMFNPSWLTSLEDAFLWIGGWRPTMAFHLLYSKSGLQLQDRLPDLLRTLPAPDLSDISPHQLHLIDRLHTATVKEEKNISEDLAKHQETVADPTMVELAHAVTEMMDGGNDDDSSSEERIDSALDTKEAGLVVVLQKADDLRLKTLKQVVEILTPIQRVHFLIAAAELHIRVHDWGGKRDAITRQSNDIHYHHHHHREPAATAAKNGGNGQEGFHS